MHIIRHSKDKEGLKVGKSTYHSYVIFWPVHLPPLKNFFYGFSFSKLPDGPRSQFNPLTISDPNLSITNRDCNSFISLLLTLKELSRKTIVQLVEERGRGLGIIKDPLNLVRRPWHVKAKRIVVELHHTRKGFSVVPIESDQGFFIFRKGRSSVLQSHSYLLIIGLMKLKTTSSS